MRGNYLYTHSWNSFKAPHTPRNHRRTYPTVHKLLGGLERRTDLALEIDSEGILCRVVVNE